MSTPSKKEFIKGINEFEKREKRDAMYKIATFLIEHFWNNSSRMADSLGVLLLTWNQAFYRYGSFDFDILEKCIEKNLKILQKFREMSITDLSEADEKEIENLFNEFMDALQIVSDKRKSPVAVAKALHLLAPNFFPLWDKEIARAYGCNYNNNPAKKYISFCKKIRSLAEKVQNYKKHPDKTLLKLIDEYNYSKYTKKWI